MRKLRLFLRGKTGHVVEPEMSLLSRIVADFNDMFGNINWKDPENVQRQIVAIPEMVSKDETYQNAMRNSDEQSARLESERALQAGHFLYHGGQHGTVQAVPG